MKKQTRRMIGAIILWTGLLVMVATNITLLSIRVVSSVNLGLFHAFNWINLGCIAAVIFGGVWGMRD